MAGPEFSRATAPASTYTPAPSVLPTPRAIRSKVLRQRARREPSVLQSTTFTLSSRFPKPFSISRAMAGRSQEDFKAPDVYAYERTLTWRV
ncbi:hypothetical protein SKAU_G00086130 [Synaphobranchus kaupii]|uniref:Uncharacterized protein n=1 Tax=Synaphobranchus kaupii TaxID=118154 RepID=A0A9Q1FVS8_SYNKA|nr:hypothetical protein SKAU_G00086130 [Synaphobranchus kaupii]